MSSHDTVVAEYLREIEQRLHGLPVLQRRELLGDLEAHIETERADRAVSSETDLLRILERLGSPEVVAAAAYEEAGLPVPPVSVDSAVAVPVAAGAVTYPASARFSGRAERTAAIGTADLLAAESATPGIRNPAAFLPPPSAPVIPPPDDELSRRRGPFPPHGPSSPGGPGRAAAGSGMPSGPGASGHFPRSQAGPWLGSGPPFVGGPPLPPPPPRRPDSTAWIRALLAGAAVLTVFVLIGCLGSALLLSGPSSDVEPAQPVAVVPEEPADRPELPQLPTP